VSAVLGIATIAYQSNCYFNLYRVIVTFFFAILGIKIGRFKPAERVQGTPEEATMYGNGGRCVFSIIDERPTIEDAPDASEFEFKSGSIESVDADSAT